jgi:hypothetical protein
VKFLRAGRGATKQELLTLDVTPGMMPAFFRCPGVIMLKKLVKMA